MSNTMDLEAVEVNFVSIFFFLYIISHSALIFYLKLKWDLTLLLSFLMRQFKTSERDRLLIYRFLYFLILII